MRPAALSQYPSLRGLTDARLDELERTASRRTLASGERIDADGALYLVARGHVTVSTHPDGDGRAEVVRHHGPGDLFAPDDALVHRATGDVEAHVWERDDLDPVLLRQLDVRMSMHDRRAELADLLRRTRIFRDTNQSLVRRLVASATLALYESGDVICREGERGDAMYVVVSGEVDVAREDDVVNKLRAGDFLGEIALVRETARTATAVAATDAEVLVVAKDAFDDLYRRSPAFRETMRASAELRLELDGAVRNEPELVCVLNDTPWPADQLVLLVADALGDERAYLVRPGYDAEAGTVVHFTTDAAAPPPETLATTHRVVVVDADAYSAPTVIQTGAFTLTLPARLDGAPLGDASARVLGRLARAIARRRVGLALGGGAAWGLAHVALLRGLERENVPVDVIVGVSCGSVVGAFYASDGLRGLERLLAAKHELTAACVGSIATTSVMDLFVRRHFSERRVEELPLPCAAVAVDARTGRERVFRSGPLAVALRSSCTLPGVFGRPLFSRDRYLDACVRHNVPVSHCADADADFVIACDVVPPPRPTPASGSGLKRFATDVLQVNRLTDTVRSLYWLASSSRDLQVGLADAVWAPGLDEFAPWDFHRAEEIVERADEQLESSLRQIAGRYRELARA